MIAVFGGTGLLGNYLLLELLKSGKQVKVLVRSENSKLTIKYVLDLFLDKADKIFELIEWVEGDLLDYEAIYSTIEGAEYVYNCAAMVSFDPKEQADIFKTNIEGTGKIVNACLELGVKKLCHVSSIAVLGDSVDSELITENDSWNTLRKHSVYSESKYKSELEVWRGIEEGLNAVIVNPSVILGYNNTKSGTQSFFTAIQKGLKYYPPGSTGFVDVRDVAKCMVLLIEGDFNSNRYIISSENALFKDLLALVAQYLNKSEPKKELTRFTANLAVKLEKMRSVITRSKPKITKSSLAAGFGNQAYSNNKITEALNFKFLELEETIQNISMHYVK